MTEVAGTSHANGLPAVFSTLEREYAAARTGAALIDRATRGRMTFSGAGAVSALNGLVTNDVAALSQGAGCYAAALSPKGKLLADLAIFVRHADVLVSVSPASRDAWVGMIRKYVNPRSATYRDVSSALAQLGVFGARAAEVVSAATEAAVASMTLHALGEFAHIDISWRGVPLTIARVPDAGSAGFDLFIPAERSAELQTALRVAGAEPAGYAAWEVVRVEAGRPEFGADMNETTLPQEANLDTLNAMSFDKGCYTGQETVARIHFRGHVNRCLKGLRSSTPFESPMTLRDAAGTEVGQVRSAVISPRLGAIGLGMVRREIAEGSRLTADTPNGPLEVEVLPLPFPP